MTAAELPAVRIMRLIGSGIMAFLVRRGLKASARAGASGPCHRRQIAPIAIVTA